MSLGGFTNATPRLVTVPAPNHGRAHSLAVCYYSYADEAFSSIVDERVHLVPVDGRPRNERGHNAERRPTDEDRKHGRGNRPVYEAAKARARYDNITTERGSRKKIKHNRRVIGVTVGHKVRE